MALTWEALATRDVRLLSQALERRHSLPPGTAWINYVRSHDDIGWTYADEDAAELGINGFDHRRFLNAFYVNRHPGSFARGVAFQDNPRTGDCRISGTTGSLCGLEDGSPEAIRRVLLVHSIAISTGGIPLIYLGDEVGQLNDYSYAEEPGHESDSRWVHRPHYPAQRYERRNDPSSPEGRIYDGLKKMLAVRAQTPEFEGTRLIGFETHNRHVLGYQRPGDGLPGDGLPGDGLPGDGLPGDGLPGDGLPGDDAGKTASMIVVFANFSDSPQHIASVTLGGLASDAVDLFTGRTVPLSDGLTIPAQEFAWLRARPVGSQSSRT
jgi:amylosucrase